MKPCRIEVGERLRKTDKNFEHFEFLWILCLLVFKQPGNQIENGNSKAEKEGKRAYLGNLHDAYRRSGSIRGNRQKTASNCLNRFVPSKVFRKMEGNGNSWADQWDYKSDPTPHQPKKASSSSGSGGGGGKYKQKVEDGMEKTKAVAATGVKKVKDGTSVGIQWIKDKYLKTTKKSST